MKQVHWCIYVIIVSVKNKSETLFIIWNLSSLLQSDRDTYTASVQLIFIRVGIL
jgi:hypothetical protein